MPFDSLYSKRFPLFVSSVAVSALLLTGCAGSSGTQAANTGATNTDSTTPSSTASSTTSDPARTAYPLEVDTCGTTTTFAQAPERVVTAKSSTMEMLLALGTGDTIIGTSYQDGPLPQWLESAANNNEAIANPLSDKLAGQEALLELEPDLVYVGWESNLSADGMGERASYEKLGVNTVVAPSACKAPGYQPDPLTYDDIFNEIQLAGRIFDVQDQASQLVDKQKTELAQVQADSRGLTALWYSSGSDTPFVGGGKGSAQLTLDTIGLENIASEIEDTWGSMSWEKVIEADPDVIVLVDSAWGTTEKKIGVLEGNPATSQLTAVKNKRYLVVPFPATEAGVRSVSAATDLAEQLAELELDK